MTGRRWLAIGLFTALLSGFLPAGARESANVQIAAGEAHVVALREDGCCQAFGDNRFGQCAVRGWRDVISVSAGRHHTVALQKDGSALACGDNSFGQCDIGAWRDLVSLSAGSGHTVGLRKDGSVVACGFKGLSQGLLTHPAASPTYVENWRNVAQISAGGNTTVALTRDNKILICGDLFDPEDAENVSQRVRQVLAGPQDTALILYEDGSCAARGYSRRLSADDDLCSVCHPGADRFIPLHPHALSYFTDISALFSGAAAAAALTKEGRVRFAGKDTLGLSVCERWEDIVQLAIGGSFAVGLRKDGSLLYAGAMPGDMEGLGTWQDVSFAASPHGMSQTDAAAAVKKDGSLLSWSCEQDLRLFYDVLTDVAHWRDVTKLCMNPQFTAGLQSNGRVCATAGAPEAIAAWSDIVDISSAEGMKEGSAFILGLKKDGSVLFAGEDDAGQGDVQEWRGIVSVAAGSGCSIGLTREGRVLSCGDNSFGQRDVKGWEDIMAVSCGAGHTAGLKKDGSVVACGRNDYGQCEVSGWRDAVKIAAGACHTAALFADGSCAARGCNLMPDGEGGFTEERGGQTEIDRWQGIRDIFAGFSFTGGIRPDGSLALAGYGNADLSALQGIKLSDGPLLFPYPPPVPGERAEEVREKIARAKADYLACLAIAGRRDTRSRAIAKAHPEYEDVFSFHKGLALVRIKGLYGLIDETGKTVLPAAYKNIYRNAKEGMSAVEDTAGRIGFIDESGVLRAPCKYDLASDFSGGYARVALGDIFQKTWEGVIDRAGKEYSLAAFRKLTGIDPDDIPARSGDHAGPSPLLLFSVPEDAGDHEPARYGYKDKDGHIVMPAMFDSAREFEDGLAEVIINDVTGYINLRGEVVSGLGLSREWLDRP